MIKKKKKLQPSILIDVKKKYSHDCNDYNGFLKIYTVLCQVLIQLYKNYFYIFIDGKNI